MDTEAPVQESAIWLLCHFIAMFFACIAITKCAHLAFTTKTYYEDQLAFWLYALQIPFGLMYAMSILAVSARRWFGSAFKDTDIDCNGDSEMASMMESHPHITVIVPAYLPNEEDIIEDTISYILEKLEWPGELTLHVAYNTPVSLPEIEDRLDALCRNAALPWGRIVKVQKVSGSTSKAENLNAALKTIATQHVAIYDADHYPDPQSLMVLHQRLVNNKLDCVQGSVYIRNLDSSILGRLVDIEFMGNWFLNLPALRMVSQFAFFGGSNAIWNREVLMSIGFDADVQTEDIDLSFKALLESRRIEFCPEARSGELAPVSIGAFFRQRLRWAVGWEQVSLSNFKSVACGDLRIHRRCGLFYALYARYFHSLIAFLSNAICPLLVCTGHLPLTYGTDSFGRGAAQAKNVGLIVLLGVWSIYIAEISMQVVQRKCYTQFVVGVIFLIGLPIYSVFQLCLLLISIIKLITGRVDAWYVSPRKKGGTLRHNRGQFQRQASYQVVQSVSNRTHDSREYSPDRKARPVSPHRRYFEGPE
jgi:cellulose synthase/poly-beta-1,6-N-acetylglucosamine synthase-like glycosyltransferase